MTVTIEWHDVKYRRVTEEEIAQFKEQDFEDYEIPEWMFDCPMPDDGEEILIVTEWGVDKDINGYDDCYYYLESRGEWDGVIAWAEMPKYRGA